MEMNANGPIRALGGAGTGKTVALMHRARHLARNVFDGRGIRLGRRQKAGADPRLRFTTASLNTLCRSAPAFLAYRVQFYTQCVDFRVEGTPNAPKEEHFHAGNVLLRLLTTSFGRPARPLTVLSRSLGARQCPTWSPKEVISTREINTPCWQKEVKRPGKDVLRPLSTTFPARKCPSQDPAEAFPEPQKSLSAVRPHHFRGRRLPSCRALRSLDALFGSTISASATQQRPPADSADPHQLLERLLGDLLPDLQKRLRSHAGRDRSRTRRPDRRGPRESPTLMRPACPSRPTEDTPARRSTECYRH